MGIYRPGWVNTDRKYRDRNYSHNPTYKENQSFYQSKEWRNLRDLVRQREPLCRECLNRGVVKLGQAIDHIKPRKDYPELALDESNLQNLCNFHHNRKRQYE